MHAEKESGEKEETIRVDARESCPQPEQERGGPAPEIGVPVGVTTHRLFLQYITFLNAEPPT